MVNYITKKFDILKLKKMNMLKTNIHTFGEKKELYQIRNHSLKFENDWTNIKCNLKIRVFHNKQTNFTHKQE